LIFGRRFLQGFKKQPEIRIFFNFPSQKKMQVPPAAQEAPLFDYKKT